MTPEGQLRGPEVEPCFQQPLRTEVHRSKGTQWGASHCFEQWEPEGDARRPTRCLRGREGTRECRAPGNQAETVTSLREKWHQPGPQIIPAVFKMLHSAEFMNSQKRGK